jgi:Na+-transporting methylmalonyl-CoA/oxaloacetate decarboxylase gamma subunit
MSRMTDLQVKFLILGIGFILVKLSLLVTVLIVAKKIQKRATALKAKQRANQAAAQKPPEVTTNLRETIKPN